MSVVVGGGGGGDEEMGNVGVSKVASEPSKLFELIS